mgnify:FL=1|jgi:hypothetical protein
MKLMQVNTGTGYLDSLSGLTEQTDLLDRCIPW